MIFSYSALCPSRQRSPCSVPGGTMQISPLTGHLIPHAQLADKAALFDIDDFHIAVPMQRHGGKILGDCAGIDVEGKQYIAVLFGFLQLNLMDILHTFHLKMIGSCKYLRLFRKKYLIYKHNIANKQAFCKYPSQKGDRFYENEHP